MWFRNRYDRALDRIERIVSANQDKINAVATQLTKAKAELVTEIQALKDQVAAGESLDFSTLESLAQNLDDINPDPAPELTPDEPAEPTEDPTEPGNEPGAEPTDPGAEPGTDPGAEPAAGEQG